MYKKVILILFVVLAISSAIYALFDRRPVTTSSDKAYKAYEKGMDYSYKLYHKESLQEYERAINLDPQFAMAHLKAAAYYWEYGQRDKYEESREKALALVDKVKDIERLQILLSFARMDRKTKDNFLLNTFEFAHAGLSVSYYGGDKVCINAELSNEIINHLKNIGK